MILIQRETLSDVFKTMAHPLFVLGSLSLTLALVACGISFFGPYWLYNVTNPLPNTQGHNLEQKDPYILQSSNQKNYTFRGLWAQCAVECQWFWQYDYVLEYQIFKPLGWHLAVQVLYFVGTFLVLFCEIFARVQLCCSAHKSVYRALGFTLLCSFVIQSAAVAVFGGFANRDYGATPYATQNTYLGWCFWMTVAGGTLTLLSGVLFLFMECCGYDDDDDDYDK